MAMLKSLLPNQLPRCCFIDSRKFIPKFSRWPFPRTWMLIANETEIDGWVKRFFFRWPTSIDVWRFLLSCQFDFLDFKVLIQRLTFVTAMNRGRTRKRKRKPRRHSCCCPSAVAVNWPTDVLSSFWRQSRFIFIPEPDKPHSKHSQRAYFMVAQYLQPAKETSRQWWCIMEETGSSWKQAGSAPILYRWEKTKSDGSIPVVRRMKWVIWSVIKDLKTPRAYHKKVSKIVGGLSQRKERRGDMRP